MSDISERLVVNCPYHEAPSYLSAFAAEHQSGDGGTVNVRLRLPVRMFADRRPLNERSFVATLYPLHATSDRHRTYCVTWSPQTDALFPAFAGALVVEKGPHSHSFGLFVSGHYQSPVDSDTTFDAALGHRVTHGTARDLLRSIADHVENAWAHAEAARAGYSALTHFARDWSDTGKISALSGIVDFDRETEQRDLIGRKVLSRS